jgi:hypothetical protein
MDPTVERFRALARSSPWRWSTLRYVQRLHLGTRDHDVTRVFIRRPKLARTEQLDGTLLSVYRDEPQQVTPLRRRGYAPAGTRLRRRGGAAPVALPGPADVEVELDDDGLVRRRPGRMLDTDTAVLGSYYEVAALDPVELADGHDDTPGATIETLCAVDHHGREAWEAVLRPTPVYDPRCPCCPLLECEPVDGGFDLREEQPGFVFPDAHRVRLDVETGICVANEQLGGTREGAGHDLTIEAVDEPLDDELFLAPPGRWSRLLGRQ